MKKGKTLVGLAEEIQRQADNKRDFITPTTQLRFDTENGVSRLHIADKGDFVVTDHTHSQIGDRLQIPSKFYKRMQEKHPYILDFNVNQLFQREPEQRMIRTLDGAARAMVSNRYRRLDNFDLAEAVLPVISEKKLELASCEITDSRMYLKAISHSVKGEVRVGDVYEAGVMVSNSEIGKGSLKVQPFLNRLICSNGAVINDLAQSPYHVGRSNGSDEAMEIYRDETLELEDRAFWAKVIDTINAVFSQDIFDDILGRIAGTIQNGITGDPVKVVEVFSRNNNLNDTRKSSILQHLVKGGELSQYGLFNAVTASAQDPDIDYDTATELESLGGAVIELKPSEWRVLSASK